MRKLSEIKVRRNIVIISHRFMDPDAIASAIAVKSYLQVIHPEVEIRCMDMDCKLGKCGNRHEMVQTLKIELDCVDDIKGNDLIFVDAQPNQGNSIEVANMDDVIAIIDHHATENIADYVGVDYVNIAPQVGAASTLVYHATKDIEIGKKEYTALLYGLLIDTQDLIFNVSKYDLEAHKNLYELSNTESIINLKNSKAPMEIIEIAAKAFTNYELISNGEIFIGYCGKNISSRNLSIMAETVLKIQEIKAVIMYTRFESSLRLSCRTGTTISAKSIYDVLLDLDFVGGHKTNQVGGIIKLYNSDRKDIMESFRRGWERANKRVCSTR